jgi:hypothetical protein
MKTRLTQFGARENTASSRQHNSRLTVDSLQSTSEALPRNSQHGKPRQAFTFRASEPNESVITTPQDAATGEKREANAEDFSPPATIISAKESRQVGLSPEPFVSADEAALFLCVKRRYLLELARRGMTGAYALGTGGKRKLWVFRLSELAASVVRNDFPIPKSQEPCTIASGSPR